MKPTVIDLFCGAGGFSEGFRQAGFDIILGIDKEPKMLAVYRANHLGTEVWERDVLTIGSSELPNADVIIGSPPCQDFSMGSSKKNPEKGMMLVNWMLDAVRRKKPRFWVMENVPPVVNYLPNWIPVVKILNAAEYGVPQARKRCFAGDYPVPRPTHNNGPDPQFTLDGRILNPWVTVRNVIEDLPTPILSVKRSKKGDDVTFQPYYHIDEPAHTVANTPHRFVEPEGRAGRYLTSHTHQRHPIHYNRKRRMTVSECARLQSFPDSYKFVGSLSWQFRHVGEAVPPLLAQRIAEEMRSSL